MNALRSSALLLLALSPTALADALRGVLDGKPHLAPAGAVETGGPAALARLEAQVDVGIGDLQARQMRHNFSMVILNQLRSKA